ncbi:LuxR C-terminal-related transcriptional regulator [Streptomyces sp. NPDC056437]|uniref:helix-turn-helix transcriptional regulator n=1 Tax=Streptomyces sp. NPDC056437 TaxID=3345816 RepID=UPI00367A90AA
MKEGRMCGSDHATGPAEVAEVCERGLKAYESAIYEEGFSGDIPECVLGLGLLRSDPELAGNFLAVSPDVAYANAARPIERTIESHQNALADVLLAIDGIRHIHRRVHRQRVAPVETLDDPAMIASALERAVQSCQVELLTAQPGGGRSPQLLRQALDRDLELNERGAVQRTLYQHTVRTHGPTMAYVERVTEAGAQVRTLDEVFDRVIICDRRIAFIPGEGDRSTSVLTVQHPGLVNHLATMFEYMWARARSIDPKSVSQRSPLISNEIRSAVLRLMVDGFTDEAIAKRLGMSVRTVATHIKKTSDALGSRSRPQLAYLIGTTGLLSGPGNSLSGTEEREVL